MNVPRGIHLLPDLELTVRRGFAAKVPHMDGCRGPAPRREIELPRRLGYPLSAMPLPFSPTLAAFGRIDWLVLGVVPRDDARHRPASRAWRESR